jgi:hypothetical protein
MNRINICWDIISHSLPRVKQHANDRIFKVEEIKKVIEYPAITTINGILTNAVTVTAN